MIDFILSGNFFWDTIVFPKNILQKNKNNLSNIKEDAGGILNHFKIFSKNKKFFFISFSLGTDFYSQLFTIKYKKYNKFFLFNRIKGRTDRSVIFLNLKSSSRTSLTDKGVCRFHKPKKFKYHKIHHIAYLDSLKFYNINKLKEIKKKCKFLSADLCRNNLNKTERVDLLNKIKFLDILIISKDELNGLFPKKKIF